MWIPQKNYETKTWFEIIIGSSVTDANAPQMLLGCLLAVLGIKQIR
jgi:hypothetical protein